jgi:hypothetical protein
MLLIYAAVFDIQIAPAITDFWEEIEVFHCQMPFPLR